MDYPFHKDGPINSKYGSTEYYMKYILTMIEKYRVEGKPVILVGHSFGVNVIAEFITRYPFAADAVVMLSPGGFTEELAVWAREKTTLMLKSFPHFVFNEMGSRWAGFINRGFVWNKTKNRKFKDPTLVNPKLKVRIVSGEWEEFVPGPLEANGLPKKVPRTYDVLSAMKQFFRRAETVMEPEVGHLVHSHIDKNGHDLVIREILKANSESVENSYDITETVSKERKKILTEVDQALQKQLLEPFFKAWLNETYGLSFLAGLVREKDEIEGTKLARRVLSDFKKFEDWRHEIILHNLKDSQNAFYIENQEKIDANIKTKTLNERTQIINAYYFFLVQDLKKQAADVLSGNLIEKWKLETKWNLAERLLIESRPLDPNSRKNQKPDSSMSCRVFYKRAG
jgi:hypothetical protein